MKRVPLCSVEYCPDGSNPDWHRCLLTGSLTIHHHHVKGRVGILRTDKQWVVPLAPHVHENITLHTWTDGTIEVEDMPIRYFILDERGNTLLDVAPYWMQEKNHAHRSQHTGAADREVDVVVLPDVPHRPDLVAGAGTERDVRGRDGIEEKLTFDDWAARTRQYALTYRSMGWLFGDHLVGGEDVFGDMIWQVVDTELGIDHGTVLNWMSVCRAFPPSRRHEGASFTVHALLAPVARKDPDEAQAMLQEIVDKGITSTEVRALRATQREVCTCPTCGKEHRP